MNNADKEKKSNISVLQIVFVWGSGGVERLISNYAENLKNITFDVLVLQKLSKDAIFTETIENNGGKIYLIGKVQGNMFKRLCERVLRIRDFTREHHYDIIHVNGGTGIDISYLLAAKQGDKDAVAIMQSHADNVEPPQVTKKKLFHYFFRSLLSSCPEAYLACSESSMRWMFGKRSYKKKANKVLMNGIEIDKFRYNPSVRQNIRNQLALSDTFVIGTVGRIAPQKNPYFILDLITKLCKSSENIRFLWVGDGPLLDTIKEEARKNNIFDKIIFTGAVTNISDYYQAMDLFILPSVYEGLGIVNIEAQCSGLPCIVSDVVPKEAKICNSFCYLPIDNVDLWVSTIIEMSANKNRSGCSEMVKSAGFDRVDCAHELENFYRSILE